MTRVTIQNVSSRVYVATHTLLHRSITMSRKNARELLALLSIAQARFEERTINEVKAELAARAVLGVPDRESREYA